MNNKSQELVRIEWIDIFKGIMIILVVIGHATGIFNKWIYQFHMAAFFGVSGYLSDFEKKGNFIFLIKKIVGILLPACSFVVIGALLNGMINHLGYHEFLFGYSYLGFFCTIKEFFVNGLLYIQYLGTFWFLATLFGVELLTWILFQVLGKVFDRYILLISVGLFALGYYFVAYKEIVRIGIFEVDLIFIAQMYYVVGSYIKKYSVRNYLNIDNRISNIVLGMSAIIAAVWGIQNEITVDYPSRRFSNPFSDFLLAIASIYIIYYLSVAISKNFSTIKKVFSHIGRKSLGIMILHFMFFKIYMIVLYKNKIATEVQIQNVVLPNELQEFKYWVPMAAFSLICSLALWTVLSNTPAIRFFLGQDSKINNIIYHSVDNNIWLMDIRKGVSKRIVLLKDNAKNRYLNNKRLYNCLMLFFLALIVPLYRTGIIINDELQARCLAMTGFRNFYKSELAGWIRQGRLLAAPINSLTKWLSFTTPKIGTLFRVPSIIIIIGIIIAFAFFNYKLFKDKWYALFTSICAAGLMPITFEHTLPNAFVGFIGIDILLILVSATLYINYIELRIKRYSIFSMICFFISCMSYEAFVTYALLFLLLVLYKTGGKDFKTNLWLYLIPIFTACIYLGCYVLSGRIVSSGYDGNQIGISNLIEPFRILIHLATVSIPGVFVFIPKYQYLKKLYYNNINTLDYIRIALIIITFILLCKYIIEKGIDNDEEFQGNNKRIIKLKHLRVLIGGVLFMFVPSLPISISEMYQHNVGFESGFIALPVTFMEYFAAVFVICYAIWAIMKRVGKKFALTIALLLCMLVINIQEMNDTFSNQQNKDFNRLVQIENYLNTDTIKQLPDGEYYGADLYEQKNILAIHDNYWSKYCNDILGTNIQVGKNRIDSQIGAFYFEDDVFVVVTKSELIVMSKEHKTQSKPIRIDEDNCILFDFQDSSISQTISNGIYCYRKDIKM